MAIDSHGKNLRSSFLLEVLNTVDSMFLIPNTFPGLPIDRWTSLNGMPTGLPCPPSLGHGLPKGLGQGPVPRVVGVNFQWVCLVALDKEQSGSSL